MRLQLHAVALGSWLFAMTLPAHVAADELRWNLKLEGGSEYDTNVHRLEVAADDEEGGIVASPLLRGGARLRLDWRPGKRQRAALLAFTGAKLYDTSGQDENVAILTGEGRYEWSLPRQSAIVAGRAGYYDTIHYDVAGRMPLIEPRHFSMAGGELALTVLGPDDHRLVLGAGYRRFRYKPSASFHWQGDHYGLLYRTTTWRGNPDEDLDAASIDLILSYEIEQRGYEGEAFTNVCSDEDEPRPECFSPMGIARTDLHHAGAAEIVYTSDRIYSARYEIDVTDSNSFGQSLVRQRLEIGFTTEIPARVFLTAKAAVQLDIFLDSLLLARDVTAQDFTTIDDENRNSLSIHLARDLTDAWSIEGRYALFSNEFATRELSFRRQVFYVGAVYEYQP